MALQTQASAPSTNEAYGTIRGTAFNSKAQAENHLTQLQAGNVGSTTIFRISDMMTFCVSTLNANKTVAGLDAWATSQGYVGSMVADCTTTVNAAQTCISWVVRNFPVDAANFLQAQTINADGTRVDNQFTSAQTAALQNDLQAFIQTIA